MKEPFEVLVRRHGPTVLRVCRAVLGPHDAQDAWSETFLAALRAYPGLDDGANVEAWLVTIAHRKALDVLRAGARTVPVADVPDRPAPDCTDGRDLDVWRALGDLADKQRVVVAYHYLAGLGYREVAQIIGGSEAAARRAGADGVAALRRALGIDKKTSRDLRTRGVVA
ncbi:MAG: RNA polymerase sigma factor [Actinomycetales bacterium]|nr:RNA polymerase sigma factor [Actinomycetales bacterium]